MPEAWQGRWQPVATSDGDERVTLLEVGCTSSPKWQLYAGLCGGMLWCVVVKSERWCRRLCSKQHGACSAFCRLFVEITLPAL